MRRLRVLKRRKSRNTRKARTVRSSANDWSCARPRERHATRTNAAAAGWSFVGSAAWATVSVAAHRSILQRLQRDWERRVSYSFGSSASIDTSTASARLSKRLDGSAVRTYKVEDVPVPIRTGPERPAESTVMLSGTLRIRTMAHPLGHPRAGAQSQRVWLFCDRYQNQCKNMFAVSSKANAAVKKISNV